MTTILIIITVLTIEYFYDDIKKYRGSKIILESYFLFQKKMGTYDFIKNKSNLLFVLLILILGMIIMTISSHISSFLYFTISLIVLAYSLRTNQYNKDIEELKIKLEFKKDNIDKSLLFTICPNLKQTKVKSNINNLVIKNIFFNSIRNTFSILFYFILLGAPAALAYKVYDYMIYNDGFKITAKGKQDLKAFMYFIDYIPVRLTSYTFSIVSSYDEVMNKLDNLKLSNNNYLSNIEFINQTGESVYNEMEKESDQIVQIQNILSRTLITWLGIISLLAVTGIFV
jgi:membrane protein required for beta-lactamase induction|tara:strand:- start:16 stop:870 length:855 start_codon:yes stop_codon:yes gene_type:complete